MQRLTGELTRPVTLCGAALRDLSRLRTADLDSMAELARAPTPAELSERTGLPPDRAAELQAADRPPRSTGEPVRLDEIGERLGVSADRAHQMERRAPAKLRAAACTEGVAA
jgi:DNA-directed RNA polymerase sigma subunit (sigma70/sigma32)